MLIDNFSMAVLPLEEFKKNIDQCENISFQDVGGWTILHFLVFKNKLTYIQELMKKDIDINLVDNDGKTALHYACEGGYMDIVEFLVQSGIAINKKDENGWTALHCASFSEAWNICKFLIKNDADITMKTDENQFSFFDLINNKPIEKDFENFIIKIKNLKKLELI